MKPIEMIWAMFKVYLNNPNYFVKQEDVHLLIYVWRVLPM